MVGCSAGGAGTPFPFPPLRGLLRRAAAAAAPAQSHRGLSSCAGGGCRAAPLGSSGGRAAARGSPVSWRGEAAGGSVRVLPGQLLPSRGPALPGAGQESQAGALARPSPAGTARPSRSPLRRLRRSGSPVGSCGLECRKLSAPGWRPRSARLLVQAGRSPSGALDGTPCLGTSGTAVLGGLLEPLRDSAGLAERSPRGEGGSGKPGVAFVCVGSSLNGIFGEGARADPA